jgi:hypothetical protein
MKETEKTKIILESLAAEYLFGSTFLLLYLCEAKKQLAFYKSFYGKEKAQNLPTQFFEGFKLALVALLHRVVSQAIEAPESIGVRRSKKIDWAYHFGSEGQSTIHKLPNLSAQGILITNLLTFRKKILESKNWDSLWEATESLRDFFYPFQEIFLSCYCGKIQKSDEDLNPENALRTKLPALILIFMNDERNLHLAFNEMYRLNPSHAPLERYKTRLESKEVRTNEDPLQFLKEDVLESRGSFFENVDIAGIFLEGFKFANISLWRLVLGDHDFGKSITLFRDVETAESWTAFVEAFDKLNEEIVSLFERANRTNETDLIFVKKVPTDLSRKLIVPLEKTKARRIEISDVLNHRPAKVISFEGSNGVSQFCTVLLGLVNQHRRGIMKEKAQVVEFIHKQKYRGNDYSYGLFIPTSSNIADYSRWWIFYRCATDHSGYGSSCLAQVRAYLESLRPHIHFRKFTINEETFFDYLKSDYIKFIEAESRRATDDNNLLRGAFLELLVALIFVKLGFNVKLRHKSKLLRGKEIDIVATKQNAETDLIYIVECKERSLTADIEEFDRISQVILAKKRENGKGFISFTPSDAMHVIIEEFERRRLRPLKSKLREFAAEINHHYTEKTKIIGVLATTELFEDSKQISPDIELWTYWTLKRKFQETNIDKSFIEIIECYLAGKVARPIIDMNFFKDYLE